MTDDADKSNDEALPPSAAPAPGEETKPAAQSRPRRRLWPWLGALLVIALIAALAGGGYAGQQAYLQLQQRLVSADQQEQAQQQLLARLRGDLQEFAQTQQQLQTEFSTLEQQVRSANQQQERSLAAMGERLDGQQARINSLSSTSREDWQLAEAEYLLRLANQRLLLEQNPANAIALLQTADSIIREVAAGMGDRELFAIRESLGRELTALKLVDQIDREGSYIELQALAERVTELPRAPQHGLHNEHEAELLDVAAVPADQPWYTRLWLLMRESVGALDQYIRIEDSGAPAQPLVSLQQTELAGANVRLYLQQAQITLLKGDAFAYQQSLKEAANLVGDYYHASPERQAYVSALEALAAKNINPQLPDISGSLKLLHGFIDKLHRLDA